MRTARLFLLSFALMIGAAAVAEAQQGQGRGGNRGGMNPAAMLLADIELTAEQKVRTDSLAASYTTAMQTMRDQAQAGTAPDSASRAARMAAMQTMRTNLQASLRAVLTPAQQVVFDRNVEAMAQRQQRRQPPPAR